MSAWCAWTLAVLVHQVPIWALLLFVWLDSYQYRRRSLEHQEEVQEEEAQPDQAAP